MTPTNELLGQRPRKRSVVLPHRNARQSAATANMLYVMAGATLAYGLILEFLPEPTAKKAELAFRF